MSHAARCYLHVEELHEVVFCGTGASKPADLNARRHQRIDHGWPSSAASLCTRRHSAAPQMPVRRVLALSTTSKAFCGSAAASRYTADAFQMSKDRNAGIALHPANEPLAPARHDHIDYAGHAQHFTNGGAVPGGYKLHRIFGQPGLTQPGLQAA